MTKIKVLHCLGCLNIGGAETLLMNIYKAIDHKTFKFDFLVFNSNPGYYDEEVRKMGGEIFKLPSINNCGLMNYLNNLINFFNNNKPDIVHSHMDWQGGFIAYAAHRAGVKKIIIHSHANQSMYENNYKYKLLIRLNKILINKFGTNYLACSEIAGNSLFTKKDYEILFNGVDIDKISHPKYNEVEMLKTKLGLNADDIVLGSVGSLSANKNQSFLIKILSKMNNKKYKLILVGDGKERINLENLVKQLNLENQVIFIGKSNKVSEFLKVFDIFLFPSKLEGLGIAAMEAQISGLPCILSKNVPKEVNLNLNDVYFLQLVYEDWIQLLLNHRFKKKEIDIRSLKSSKYDINETAKHLEKIYENM